MNQEERQPYDDNVVKVYRCSKVVKGGRRFSFAALVVVGDKNGRVGLGYGKANEVPNAVEKGRKRAMRDMVPVSLMGGTIPHEVTGRFGSSRVKILPAQSGTGVIAGQSVRAVLELAGVHDCLTKVYGSTSPKNLCKATLNALIMLRDRETVAKLRGVEMPSYN
ncbi:MAG: 30S ribosomal protein S5 [Phycisphaerales bacterium]|nr:30S ribosomal protein S5 [Phycisphaerales bacterium]MCB9854837.1 30S ribosomal protein S5 [Phycisphaerales bacterium]